MDISKGTLVGIPMQFNNIIQQCSSVTYSSIMCMLMSIALVVADNGVVYVCK